MFLAERVIPVDREIAEEWGQSGVVGPVPTIDGLMAATARVREFVFVTGNVSDVARTGARTLDPFQPLLERAVGARGTDYPL
ncbi:MAG: hypothetical protein U0821_22955 [Chloroflexota bacterium]